MKSLKHFAKDKLHILLGNKLFFYLIVAVILYSVLSILFVLSLVAIKVIVFLGIIFGLGFGFLYLKDLFFGR